VGFLPDGSDSHLSVSVQRLFSEPLAGGLRSPVTTRVRLSHDLLSLCNSKFTKHEIRDFSKPEISKAQKNLGSELELLGAK